LAGHFLCAADIAAQRGRNSYLDWHEDAMLADSARSCQCQLSCERVAGRALGVAS
jgi:hypothetical protein